MMVHIVTVVSETVQHVQKIYGRTALVENRVNLHKKLGCVNIFTAGNDIALSPRKFTAVGVMSDLSACGIIRGLRQCGKRVPDDISVIGFDNLPLCTFTDPQLTTISQDIRKKAQLSGDLLLKMVREKAELTAFERITVKLVERESTGKPNL